MKDTNMQEGWCLLVKNVLTGCDDDSDSGDYDDSDSGDYFLAAAAAASLRVASPLQRH